MLTNLPTSAYEDTPGPADDSGTSPNPEQEGQTQENDSAMADDAGSNEKEHKGSAGPEEKDITD